MHISDGVLSTAVTAVTYVGAGGLLAYSLKGVKTEEIPRMALMTGVFFVGSTIHVPIGPTSLHLLLTGFIGLVVGRRAPVSILIALLLQLFLLHFGGLSSLGANVLNTGLPAVILGAILLPMLRKNPKRAFLIGLIAGFTSVVGTVFLLSLTLIESNMRFRMGAFSTVKTITLGHIPLMLIEALITAFAVQSIVKIRPDFFYTGKKRTTADPQIKVVRRVVKRAQIVATVPQETASEKE